MGQNGQLAFLHNPVFRVIVTWLWAIVSPSFVVVIVSAFLRTNVDIAFQMFEECRYLTVYVEIVSAGLLPLMLTFICKDDLSLYGLGSKGFTTSLLPSALFVTGVYGFSFLTTEHLISFESPNFNLDFPSNLWYAALGVFAYGPLEVFFFIWLIANTDRVFKDGKARMSWGLILTVIIFGSLHILDAQSISNALNIVITFFFLGLMWKYTKNSIGPMLAWTLINPQVFYFASLLLP